MGIRRLLGLESTDPAPPEARQPAARPSPPAPAPTPCASCGAAIVGPAHALPIPHEHLLPSKAAVLRFHRVVDALANKRWLTSRQAATAEVREFVDAGILVADGKGRVRAAAPVEKACARCSAAALDAVIAEIATRRRVDQAAARSAREAATAWSRAARAAEKAARQAERDRRDAERARAAHERGAFGASGSRFECESCGRYAQVAPARAAHAEALAASLAIPLADFGAFRYARPGQGIRPAVLERDYKRTYEAAVAAIALAERLGVVVRRGKEAVPAPPICATCFAARRAALEAPAPPTPTAGRDPIPPQLRFRVLKRDNFTCQYCGAKAPDVVLELDHVIPVAAGGETTEDNLITACRPCNAGKSATPVLSA